MGRFRATNVALVICLVVGLRENVGYRTETRVDAPAGNSGKNGKPRKSQPGVEQHTEVKTSSKKGKSPKDDDDDDLSGRKSAAPSSKKRGELDKDGKPVISTKAEWEATSVELSDAEIHNLAARNIFTQQQAAVLLNKTNLLYNLRHFKMRRREMITFLRVDKDSQGEEKVGLLENFVGRGTLEENRGAFDVMAGFLTGLLSRDDPANVCILAFQRGGEALLRMLSVHPYFLPRLSLQQKLDQLMPVEKKKSKKEMLNDALHMVSKKQCAKVIVMDALMGGHFRNTFRHEFMQKVAAEVHFVWLHETFGLDQAKLSSEKEWKLAAKEDGTLIEGLEGFSCSQSHYATSRLFEYKVSLPWMLVDDMECVVNKAKPGEIQKPIILFDAEKDRVLVRVVNNGETAFARLASVLCGETMKTFAHDVVAIKQASNFATQVMVGDEAWLDRHFGKAKAPSPYSDTEHE